MSYLKISIGIFLALAASRFAPHPPNFTSLLALRFYVPAILGIRYIPALVLSFVIIDFFIGFHSYTFFTWGSVIVIGFVSKYFSETLLKTRSGFLKIFSISSIDIFVINYFHIMLQKVRKLEK